MTAPTPQTFEAPQGTKIAYHKTLGKAPTVIFMGGLMSDMEGTKALYLEKLCQTLGQGFLRFDYGGHGSSSGSFEEGTIGSWHQDALSVIDYLSEGPLIVIGSSMGGWQALLAAIKRPERVKGLIGLAPAPDFTENLLWANMEQKHRDQIMEEGKVLVPSEYGDDPYIFTRDLIEDGRTHCLLDSPIDLKIPVRLIHGMEDSDVPFQVSLDIMDCLSGLDADLILVKNAGHKLSDPHQLALIERALQDLLERIK